MSFVPLAVQTFSTYFQNALKNIKFIENKTEYIEIHKTLIWIENKIYDIKLHVKQDLYSVFIRFRSELRS
jgi:hypothetical protein